MDGKPIECREMLKNKTVSRDASSHMVILHGHAARRAQPGKTFNPRSSTQNFQEPIFLRCFATFGCRQPQGLKKPSDRRYCTRTRRRRPGSWAGVARGRRRGGEGPHLLPLQRRPGCRVGLETPPDSRQSLYWRNGIVCGSVELLLGAISKAHATAIRTDPGSFGYSRKLCLINVGRIPHRTRLAAARALSGIRCCSD